MNAKELTAEAVAMVSPKETRGLTVNVLENRIAVQLVRDSLDRDAFANYREIVERLWDALTALRSSGARFNRHTMGGGVEVSSGRGRRRELYGVTYEVFSDQG